MPLGRTATSRVASALLRRGDGKVHRELLAVVVRAAEAEVLIDGGNDALSLIELADAYFIGGDKAKAREYARKAMEPSGYRRCSRLTCATSAGRA